MAPRRLAPARRPAERPRPPRPLPNGDTTAGFPARRASAIVPTPPWCAMAAARGKTAENGAARAAIIPGSPLERSPDEQRPPSRSPARVGHPRQELRPEAADARAEPHHHRRLAIVEKRRDRGDHRRRRGGVARPPSRTPPCPAGRRAQRPEGRYSSFQAGRLSAHEWPVRRAGTGRPPHEWNGRATASSVISTRRAPDRRSEALRIPAVLLQKTCTTRPSGSLQRPSVGSPPVRMASAAVGAR